MTAEFARTPVVELERQTDRARGAFLVEHQCNVALENAASNASAISIGGVHQPHVSPRDRARADHRGLFSIPTTLAPHRRSSRSASPRPSRHRGLLAAAVRAGRRAPASPRAGTTRQRRANRRIPCDVEAMTSVRGFSPIRGRPLRPSGHRVRWRQPVTEEPAAPSASRLMRRGRRLAPHPLDHFAATGHRRRSAAFTDSHHRRLVALVQGSALVVHFAKTMSPKAAWA